MALGLLVIALALAAVWVVFQLVLARSRRFPDPLPAVLADADAKHADDASVAKHEEAAARVSELQAWVVSCSDCVWHACTKYVRVDEWLSAHRFEATIDLHNILYQCLARETLVIRPPSWP